MASAWIIARTCIPFPQVLVLACFLLCIVCTASDPAPRRAEGPVVKIDSGVVEGTHSPNNPTLVFFRGIPYAAPPVG